MEENGGASLHSLRFECMLNLGGAKANNINWKNMAKEILLCVQLLLFISSIARSNELSPPDLPSGPPDAVLPNNNKYYGDIKEGLFVNHGELVGADGTYFKGEFKRGLMHGEGQLWKADGSYYRGNFTDGLMSGYGELQFTDGAFYIGEFKKNMLHGRGSLKSANGDTYTGQFQQSLFEGEGHLETASQDSFTGVFKHGEIVKGEYRDQQGNTYTGDFKNWQFHGRGVYQSTTGDEFEGDFDQGYFTGKGESRMNDGASYVGEFKEWLYHGYGTLIEKNGDRYRGYFELGTYHGQGELALAKPVDGISTVAGEWEHGYLEDDPRFHRQDRSAEIESLLYSQGKLIEKAIDNIKPGNRRKIELFFVGVAGFGDQDVFLKELQYIESIFDSRPYARKRTIMLVNHYDTIKRYPLATRVGIDKVLESVAQKMDVANDILFLYLTSHGSQDHRFSIELDGLHLPALSAEDLAEILARSKIKWKVIGISACYAGGFIPFLKDDYTLIMTAAREDRPSFGCGDDSDMTYFAKAFFKEALNESTSFISAFEKAAKVIFQWEEKDFPEMEHSEPQIFIGRKVARQLSKWRAQK